MKDIKKDIFQAAQSFAQELGLIIFDIVITQTKRKTTLEIIIDSLTSYIGIDECENFSKKIDPWLEENDPFEMKYDLIVSSPGLDRPLRDISECLRFKGRLAKFILKEPLENRTVLKGYIQEVQNDTVSILESDSKKVFTFDFSKVKKANLEIDL